MVPGLAGEGHRSMLGVSFAADEIAWKTQHGRISPGAEGR